MSEQNGPRTRDFSTLTVNLRTGGTIEFKDAFVTFFADGWVEVYGQMISQGDITKGRALPKGTYNFSNYQTVALQGDEKHHD